MPKLYYQGHGSYRITSNDGRVIFVDPYAGKGYDIPADVILVTHQHHDHNKIKRVTQKPDCRIVSNIEALAGGKHNTFDLGGGLIYNFSKKTPSACIMRLSSLEGAIQGVRWHYLDDGTKKSLKEFYYQHKPPQRKSNLSMTGIPTPTLRESL